MNIVYFFKEKLQGICFVKVLLAKYSLKKISKKGVQIVKLVLKCNCIQVEGGYVKCLGLDLGTKSLGVAISDVTGTIASSYKTLYFGEEDYEDKEEEFVLREEFTNGEAHGRTIGKAIRGLHYTFAVGRLTYEDALFIIAQ